jgi:secondary thiamine-phosphate synthase enzyme
MVNLETHSIEFSTQGNTHLVDITDKIQKVLSQSGFSEGNVTLFAVGSTTGLSTVEYEPGLVHHDVAEMYQKIAPYGVSYRHNQTWGDDNGAAHLRSTLTGSSLVIPFMHNKLILGTWQQIIFIDFDTRARSRKVVVQVLGKEK